MLHGKPDTWGLDGYEVAKRYEDPIRLKEERTGSIVRKQTDKSIKKGHYLDIIAKQNVGPGPSICAFTQYTISASQWF